MQSATGDKLRIEQKAGEDAGWHRRRWIRHRTFLYVRAVYDYFAPADDFSWLDVIDLVESNPELMLINSGVEQKHIEQG